MKKIINDNWELPLFSVFEFKKRQTKYCVGIPIVNEGEKFKRQIIEMERFANLADIIIFDGGSTDGSTNHKFLKKQKVRTLLVMKSPGRQGTQLRMGFAYALKEGYEGVITIDGNGKDGIEAIPNFIQALDDGYDYVQGSRFIEGGRAINTPFFRYLSIRLIHAPILSLTARYWYTDTTNGFRAYSRRYLLHPKVKLFRNIFVGYELLFYLTVLANQLGLKTKEIPVTRKYPKGITPTKITGIKDLITLLIVTFKVALGYFHP